jgi:hypothetical protein
MEYFTKQGVLMRTGLDDIVLWYLLCVRELLDNATDFLTKNYKGADDTVITTTIFKDDKVFRLKIRNSNYKDIPTFQNKKAMLNFDMRYGSKQYTHGISRGMLGDALKQLLAFGYILLHLHEDGSSFQEKQWDKPLIIRHNGKEFKIYLIVDKAKQDWSVDIGESKDIASKDTEIELVLPIVDEALNLDRDLLEKYCKTYPLFTTDITFKFSITDNSTLKPKPVKDDLLTIDDAVATALTTPAPRATINIEYKALHPISKEAWNKQNSVRAYLPEEFKARFVNMDSKEAAETRVYDLLLTFREGSNLKKESDHDISIAELCELPDKERDKKIEHFYKQLWKVKMPPLKELVLPYPTNKNKRKSVLMGRLSRLYGNLDKDKKRASYKPIFKTYVDEKRKISFPYFFEILAVPFDNPITASSGVEFVGAVNYSISPKENSNIFGGEDYIDYLDYYPYSKVNNILRLLEEFKFSDENLDSSKIPCVVIANLVTPRRDPHGYDKSSIDVTPFTHTIVQAVKRLASEISSYRGRNITFKSAVERRTATPQESKRGALEIMLIKYLQENHGLPLAKRRG